MIFLIHLVAYQKISVVLNSTFIYILSKILNTTSTMPLFLNNTNSTDDDFYNDDYYNKQNYSDRLLVFVLLGTVFIVLLCCCICDCCNDSNDVSSSSSSNNNESNKCYCYCSCCDNNDKLNNNVIYPKPSSRSKQLPNLKTIYSLSNSNCCICYEPIIFQSYQIKSCGHRNFHKSCLNKWIEKSNECPMCRTHILDYIEYNSNNDYE